MTLSAPVYRLKQRAKALSRQADIPLHRALDQIAAEEGYRHWNLLVADVPRLRSRNNVFSGLQPGDLMLVGARPGQGKTLLTLEVIGQALAAGSSAVFYTFEYNHQDVIERLRRVGVDPLLASTRLSIDSSDAISADYIVQRTHPRGSLIVVDYLQLLDQKRANPPLMEQVRLLRTFAKAHGVILLFISQIDRRFESSGRSMPGIADIRLPNPLDLNLFDHSCFLNDGNIRMERIVA